MKGLGLFFVAAFMFMAISCSREEMTDENPLTRSASVNDSTENKGGVTIAVDTAWNGESHIGSKEQFMV